MKLMNKKVILTVAALLLTAGISAGCGSKDTLTNLSDGTQQSGTQAETSGKASLDVTIKQDGRNATVTYHVKNLTLSDQIGQKNVPGEGHLHIYVDGKQKAMLKTTAPVKIENLSVGKHTIKLSLQQNDHQPLGVDKEYQIDVK
jgi:hypothetical protein